MEDIGFDSGHLVKLANEKIFFGKHSGKFIIDLPEPYLLWLRKQDLSNSRFKKLVEEVCLLKENGLEPLVRKFREN